MKCLVVAYVMPPVASVTYWTNGRKVAFVSTQEMFGAPRVIEQDELVEVIYPPQPASERVGCNLMSSAVTF